MADETTPATNVETAAPAERGFLGRISHGWRVTKGAIDTGLGEAVSFVAGGAVDLVDSVPKIAGYDKISKQITGNDLNAWQGMSDWFESGRRKGEIIMYGEEIRPETGLEKGLDGAGNLLGSLLVGGPATRVAKVGTTTLKGSTAIESGTVSLAEKSVAPIDALADVLTGGTRTAATAAGITTATRFGGLEAAKLAGLSTAGAFANASSTMVRGAAIALPGQALRLAANTTIGATRLAAVGGLKTAMKTAGFSLRHPLLATGAAVTADVSLNDGRLTAAATRKGIEVLPSLAAKTFAGAAALPAMLTPDIDFKRWFQSNTGQNVPVMKALEQGLGINIPDEWEAKGNQLMRDFGNSSFGQWLVGGSWGAKLLLGLLTFILFDGVKDRLIGNDMATNVVSLGVAAMASQMLPDLIKAMTESTMGPTNDDRQPTLQPQSLDFAASNPGMSFAPAGP